MKRTLNVEIDFTVFDPKIEHHDLTGAIFKDIGDIFWPELDLGDLSDSGELGRISTTISHSKDKTSGTLNVPVVETVSNGIYRAALIAAMIEALDKVKGKKAVFKLARIYDPITAKQGRVESRAKELVKQQSAVMRKRARKALNTPHS